jgi:hypothetical protein
VNGPDVKAPSPAAREKGLPCLGPVRLHESNLQLELVVELDPVVAGERDRRLHVAGGVQTHTYLWMTTVFASLSCQPCLYSSNATHSQPR